MINKKKFIKISIVLIIVYILLLLLIFFLKNKTNINNSIINSTEKNNSIPKMYFTGDIEGMQEKTDKRQIEVKYESENLNFECYAQLKVQGSYTLRFDKKNYNIAFYEDRELNDKKKVDVKWGEYSKYTLKANWTDPLHSRNIVSAQIASEINEEYGIMTGAVNNGLTDGFPIEVYINGEFLRIIYDEHS